eukprot:6109733-Prymnesium_polylepis.1
MAWRPLLEGEGRGLPEAAVLEVGARPCRRGAAPPRLVDQTTQVYVHTALPLGHERHGKDVVVRPGSQQVAGLGAG